MKRFLVLLLTLLWFIPQVTFAQTRETNLWERAAFGNLPGVRYVLLQGWNPSLAATFEDASPESTQLDIPVAALSSPYCASTDNVQDTSGGTGIKTLTLSLVTTAYAEVTETLTLTGQTSANIQTANVLGFNDVRAATVGSNGGTAGVVDCGNGTNTTGSAQFAYATIGTFSKTAVPGAGVGAVNVAHVFQYIVPANKKLICRNIQVGSTFATQASGINAVIDASTNLGMLTRYWVNFNAQANTPANAPQTVVFPEKTYLKGKMAGSTGSNTGPAGMMAECLLIDTNGNAAPNF